MRVFVTGGSGFVGSHVMRIFEGHAAEVAAPRHAELDVTDSLAVREGVVSFRPDAIVHCAILNDLAVLYADRAAGWDAYVGATRNLVGAANQLGARMLLVSTDWVFDGTQAGATEDTPPNPVNLYGFLKAASELVVSERAERGSVARIAAVQGSARGAPREQDAGFGYFVSALVERLRGGPPLVPWRLPGLRTLLNLSEWFVHHEDVRRANGQAPRTDRPDLDAALWDLVGRTGRMAVRGLKGAGLDVDVPGHGQRTLDKAEPRVTLTGGPQEVVLFLNGRRDAAQVELAGDQPALEALAAARLGI